MLNRAIVFYIAVTSFFLVCIVSPSAREPRPQSHVSPSSFLRLFPAYCFGSHTIGKIGVAVNNGGAWNGWNYDTARVAEGLLCGVGAVESGLYYWSVEEPNGKVQLGKVVVIK